MALDEIPLASDSEQQPFTHLSPRQFLSACGPADVPILERAAAFAERPRFGPRGSKGRDILLFYLFDIWARWKATLPTICGDDTRETEIQRQFDHACKAAGFTSPPLRP
ncbi:MAG: hypothetical protein TEF_08600 [Rhizobiales bacterium NRL2]|jgi:hypothetical protein|nr:MAG: hypothetical protein TEF_08600 [Rhizobiales bacterium NRL2]